MRARSKLLFGVIFVTLSVFSLFYYKTTEFKQEDVSDNQSEVTQNPTALAAEQVASNTACPSLLIPGDVSQCYRVVGETKMAEILQTAHLSKPVALELTDPSNVSFIQSDENSDYVQFKDQSSDGEHFISREIRLTKGYNYFIFDAQPSQTELYVYMTGKNGSILFPWQNLSAQDWVKMGDTNALEPVYSQSNKTTSGDERLELVVKSDADQLITLRLQHGLDGVTIYKGDERNSSSIRSVKMGQINESAS